MPRSGTPASYTAGSIPGAPGTWTDAGPPERMIAFGLRASISEIGIERGTISLYTWTSRTRRAISCAYCAPKSTTRTRSGESFTLRRTPSGHPDALRSLQRLSLGLQRGRDHHLGLLELLDGLVAGRGHRGAQSTEQVQRSVVLVRGSGQDLGERCLLACEHARTTRQRRMEGRHAPVVSPTGRLVCRRERRADHHRVGAACDRLGEVATRRHTAV